MSGLVGLKDNYNYSNCSCLKVVEALCNQVELHMKLVWVFLQMSGISVSVLNRD